MKVKSGYPVIYQQSNSSNFSSLDGTSTSAQIRFFQGWVNKFKGGKLVVDGKWGKNTQAAWNQHGASFEKVAKAATEIASQTLPNVSTSTPVATNKLGNALDKYAKVKESGILDTLKGLFGANTEGYQDTAPVSDIQVAEPKKGMSTGLKITIGVGVAALVGTIIYFVTRKKK